MYKLINKQMNFDHIGIFVKDIKIGLKHLKATFPITRYSQEYKDPLLKVIVQFCYDKDDICYELVAPYGDNNPVDSVLISNNNILNHIAYTSKTFDQTVKDLRKKGCVPLVVAKPAIAFDGARVIFFLTPLRMILEIIEK